MLYYRGRAVGRLPKGSKELARDAGKKAKGKVSEGEESEDEREVEQKVAMERYRWTRTGVSSFFRLTGRFLTADGEWQDSIVDAFGLRERSGRFASDKRTT